MYVIQQQIEKNHGIGRYYHIGKSLHPKQLKNKPPRLQYHSTHLLISEPTNNCQLSTLSNIEGFLHVNHSVEDVAEVFKALKGELATRCLLIDIYADSVNKVKEALDKVDDVNIILEAPYDNTTGSEMCLMYIDMDTTADDEDDDDYYDDEYYDYDYEDDEW